MSRLRLLSIALTGSVAAFAWSVGAMAADVLASPEPANQGLVLPAVSGVNGKWELDAGYLSDPASAVFRAGASLTAPLGDSFGVQGDVSFANSGAGPVYGGALHLFTRDPSNYLFGVTAGVIRSSEATLGGVGPEAELYFDRWSIEAWAGVAGLNYDDPLLTDQTGVFALADVAFYPTDDVRLSLGGSSVLGYNALHLGGEYLFRDLGTPLAATADARLGEDGRLIATLGLKGYFGGTDDGKSLIDRQRQDDPRNRAIDLFGAAGPELYTSVPDTEPACIVFSTPDQPLWAWNFGTSRCLPSP